MISRHTGKVISEDEHILQSMDDITITAIGTRVMRRHYGTILVPKIDAPMSAEYRMRLMSSLMIAYAEFEPRVEVRRINIALSQQGKPQINVEAVKKKNDQPVIYLREVV